MGHKKKTARRGESAKKERREEAAVRQAMREARTDEEQLARLPSDGAAKERARLAARIVVACRVQKAANEAADATTKNSEIKKGES